MSHNCPISRGVKEEEGRFLKAPLNHIGKTKKYTIPRIKNRFFTCWCQVLYVQLHGKDFLGKLKSRWSTCTITEVYSFYGTATVVSCRGSNFKGSTAPSYSTTMEGITHHDYPDTPGHLSIGTLNSGSSRACDSDSPNNFFEASRVRLICPVQLELLIFCVKLVWGDPYPFIIID
ncbi:hypothetical protein Tco_0556694 [Tanacetum coccineum]